MNMPIPGPGKMQDSNTLILETHFVLALSLDYIIELNW